MIHLNKFMFCPGGEHETNQSGSQKDEEKIPDLSQQPGSDEAGKEPKSIIEKIKDALQDWSNKDERDLEDDDTKV